jgi:hypothetical protein
MRRLFAAAAAVAASALAALGLSAAPASAAPATSQVYVVHNIPGVTVDVYLDGEIALEDFRPGTVAGPLTLPSGCCPTVTIYTAGADPNAVDPVIDTTTALPAGGTVSLSAHLSAKGTPRLSTYYDTVKSSVREGYGKLFVRHNAALGPVDVYAGVGSAGAKLTKLASRLANPLNGEYVLPAGNYRVVVVPAGGDPQKPALSGVFPVAAGKARILYATGNPADGTLGITQQVLALEAAAPSPFPAFPAFPAFGQFAR